MKEQQNKKKVWTKPVVKSLSIRRDTFSGSVAGAEAAGKSGTPAGKTW